MAFPFSRFIKKPSRENPGKAEGSKSPQDEESSATKGQGQPVDPAPSAKSQPPAGPAGEPGKVVKPIPIREPLNQKQQKKISARIHIPPISLRQPDEEPLQVIRNTPRTSLPPAPRKPGALRRTPSSRPLSDEEAQAASAPGQDNIINAPFTRHSPGPVASEPAPDTQSPSQASPPLAEEPPPAAPPQAPPPPAPAAPQKVPSGFQVGRPATPSFSSTPQQASPAASPRQRQTDPSGASSAPARPRRPVSNRLRLPTRPPQIPRPPKFGPRIDEPELPNGTQYRGEIALKREPQSRAPQVLPPKGTPIIPRIPLETKRLFARKIATPPVARPPQGRTTGTFPPVPRRTISPPAAKPAESDPESEIISFDQAQKELGPLLRTSPAPPPADLPQDPGFPMGRRETARIPLPARSGTPRPETAPTPSRTPPEQDGFDYTTLREIFLTDDPLDLPAIARLVTDFPGITHCLILENSGRLLAGEQIPGIASEDFAEKVPEMVRQVNTYGSRLGLGNSKVFTLYCEDGIISFFTEARICVSVKHHMRGFLPGVREKLERVSEEVAALHTRLESTPTSSGS